MYYSLVLFSCIHRTYTYTCTYTQPRAYNRGTFASVVTDCFYRSHDCTLVLSDRQLYLPCLYDHNCAQSLSYRIVRKLGKLDGINRRHALTSLLIDEYAGPDQAIDIGQQLNLRHAARLSRRTA